MENTKGNELAKVLYYYGFISNANTSEQKIVCPFHNDINPSMKVDLIKNSWICFGCGLNGDAIKFVRYAEKELSEMESLKKYYKILKSKKTAHIKLGMRIKERKKNIQQDLIEAKDYYYCLSKIDWKNNDTQEVIEARDYMKKRGFTENALNSCKAKITYNEHYGLIFPMLDNGEFKGWVCRTMLPSIEKKRKYLYNTGFSRATTLVGTYNDKSDLYLVEGYMDMLKFKQFGIRNVAALLGWKISNEQILKLKAKGIKRIISALDNDECGKKGSAELSKHFEVKRFCYLRKVKDPGDMTKELFEKMNKKTKGE
jgi:DNA primase